MLFLRGFDGFVLKTGPATFTIRIGVQSGLFHSKNCLLVFVLAEVHSLHLLVRCQRDALLHPHCHDACRVIVGQEATMLGGGAHPSVSAVTDGALFGVHLGVVGVSEKCKHKESAEELFF